MRYLLDTHAFIWMDSQPGQLSTTATTICSNPSNTLLLRIASIWEMQIKVQLGKLKLPAALNQIVKDQQTNGIQILQVEMEHIYGLDKFPFYHRDPFDRLLVAQAAVENIPFITNDPMLTQYGISVIW